jgi:hypothetical protein
VDISTHVVGIRPPDERWRQMKSVWDACKEAGVPVPGEVQEFFDWMEPDPSGVEVPLDTVARKWRAEMQDGFEIDVAAIPAGIKTIRFYNNYD